MALTLKKRLFAEAKLQGLTNREAAINAGYSEATASQAGSKLAKDTDVLDYTKKLEAGTAAKVKTAPKVKDGGRDPRGVLIELMDDADPKIALKAATALMPYTYARVQADAPAGKKETAKKDAMVKTNTGRFATLDNQVEVAVAKIQ